MRTPYRMHGIGLPNVYLLSGYHLVGEGDDRAVSYEKLDELYVQIGRAISTKRGALTGPELRFLRRRLDMTQAQIGALGGKTVQAVAKWEKGQTPLAESRVICLTWLQRFAPDDMATAIEAMTTPGGAVDDAGCYAFRFSKGSWKSAPEIAARIDSDHAMPIMASALTKLLTGAIAASANTAAVHRLEVGDEIDEQQT